MVHVLRLCLQEVFLPLEFLPIRACAYRSCCLHKKVITGGICSVFVLLSVEKIFKTIVALFSPSLSLSFWGIFFSEKKETNLANRHANVCKMKLKCIMRLLGQINDLVQ